MISRHGLAACVGLVAVVCCLASVPASASRWGTYRPNVYFGIKAKVPESPLLGFMWSSPAADELMGNLRHDCEERDHLRNYGWNIHDGKTYGLQQLTDKLHHVNMTTEFILDQKDGEESWIARVRAEPTKDAPRDHELTFMWYVAATTDRQKLKVDKLTKNGIEGQVTVDVDMGEISDLPSFTLIAPQLSENTHPSFQSLPTSKRPRAASGTMKTVEVDKTYVHGVNDANPWDARAILNLEFGSQWNALLARYRQEDEALARINQKNNHQHIPPPLPSDRLMFPNKVKKDSNFIVFQQIFTLPFSFDLVMIPHLASGKKSETVEPSETKKRKTKRRSDEELSAHRLFDREYVDAKAHEYSTAFSTRFESTFHLAARSYSLSKQSFARAALSNMIGGIGHFYGNSLTQKGEEYSFMGPDELLTAVPSRSFFPRGFLWDEGFHQLLVGTWDQELSQEILTSWTKLIKHDGWLPREQILGAEARRRVPTAFQIQRPTIANPPTLLLAIHQLLARLQGSQVVTVSMDTADTATSAEEFTAPPVDKASFVRFLAEVYPALQRQLSWMLRTQRSAVENTFRWSDRSLDHCLASGLDDYPRAPWLTEHEGHVDLHSWMIMASNYMAEFADYLLAEASKVDVSLSSDFQAELRRESTEHKQRAKLLLEKLDSLFWHEDRYLDFAMANGTKHHQNHVGYVSFFPLLLRLIPANSPKLQKVLSLLGKSDIFSPYGLLSLSKTDPLFGTKEDYWRGHIWFNINYLAVSALRHYSEVKGPYQAKAAKLHEDLRSRLITNLHSEYAKTHYLWEQYSAKDGRGRKSHPFTGWTALVVMLMAEY